MTLLERISFAFKAVQRVDLIEGIVAKIESLGAILDRLQTIEARLSGNDTLECLASRIDRIDTLIRKIETLEKPTVQAPLAPTLQPIHPAKDDLNEWQRLKLLSKFVTLSERAKEIEEGWQKVQQDEHNADFAYQTLKDEHSQQIFLYKKGIVDGIKWALNRFS